MKVGRITLSDRAAMGVYEDLSGPEIERVVAKYFEENIIFCRRLIPDEQELLVREFKYLATDEDCSLIITTGGTGPSERDITPEATHEVIEKELPGFGEIMRMQSFSIVKTAILSRATAGIYKKTLIVNLPGKPKAIEECLPLLVPAIAECLDHIRGFRPRLANF